MKTLKKLNITVFFFLPVLGLFSQCIDNIRCNGLMTSVFEENSKVTVPHMLK